jgi:hypothetical protein
MFILAPRDTESSVTDLYSRTHQHTIFVATLNWNNHRALQFTLILQICLYDTIDNDDTSICLGFRDICSAKTPAEKHYL